MPKKKSNLYIGIDPGATGALAILNDKKECLEIIDKKIATGLEKAEIINTIYEKYSKKHILHFAIEAPLYFMPKPSKGKKEVFSSSNAAGKLGKSQGEWVGCISALEEKYPKNVTLLEVSPSTWNKFMKVDLKILGKSLKERAENHSREHYPDHVFGPRGGYKNGRGDAICLTLYLISKTVT